MTITELREYFSNKVKRTCTTDYGESFIIGDYYDSSLNRIQTQLSNLIKYRQYGKRHIFYYKATGKHCLTAITEDIYITKIEY